MKILNVDWHRKAACRKAWVDPGWFFGADIVVGDDDLRGQAYQEQGLRARVICGTCPVFDLCWKENADAEFGVFAGTNETDRLRLLAAWQRREDRAAPKEGRKARRYSLADLTSLPAPRFKQHVAAGSVALQVASYAFQRGASIAEAAVVAEVKPELVQAALHDSQRAVA